jgi:hypothetical protein
VKRTDQLRVDKSRGDRRSAPLLPQRRSQLSLDQSITTPFIPLSILNTLHLLQQPFHNLTQPTIRRAILAPIPLPRLVVGPIGEDVLKVGTSVVDDEVGGEGGRTLGLTWED